VVVPSTRSDSCRTLKDDSELDLPAPGGKGAEDFCLFFFMYMWY
jgi:hypothetical protein